MRSGLGWSQMETCFVCKSYTAASEDPRKGSGKKKEVFAKRVLEAYNKLVSEHCIESQQQFPTLTAEAICQRHRKAKAECLKLDEIKKAILKRKPTESPTFEDIEHAAVAIYNGEVTISHIYTYFRDKIIHIGVEFQFMQAYQYLKTTKTWEEIIVSRSAPNSRN